MSFAQRRVWFLERYYRPGAAYHLTAAFRFEGEINTAALEKSIGAIALRHETLRTRFGSEGEDLWQAIEPQSRLQLHVTRAESLSAAQVKEQVGALASQPFNLEEGSLLRFHLLKAGRDQSILLVVMHHIISDGWSLGVLVKETMQYYHSFASGAVYEPAPLSIQYVDYSEWQREWLNEDRRKTLLDYWAGRLQGLPPCLALPTDRDRPKVQSHQGAVKTVTASRELAGKLNALCLANDVSLYMLLLAAYAVLLSRFSQEEDIAIGTPVANRGQKDLEPLIGFFANTLVLRVKMQPHQTFTSLLQEVKEITTGAFQHQELPFELLVETLNPARSSAYTPFFQVFFALQNAPIDTLTLPGVTVSPFGLEQTTSKFDLSLFAEETPAGLRLKWEYCTALFSDETISTMSESFEALLLSIVASPDADIPGLNILSPAARERVLHAFNQTQRQYRKGLGIVDLFEEQVALNPSATALLSGQGSLSYGELNALANRFAAYVSANYSIQPNETIALKMDRGAGLVIAMLGILKAGGAYVPIDPAYPAERIAFMMQDSGSRLLVDEEEFSKFSAGSGDYPAINPAKSHNPGSLAYIIYTSGSTGQPKGVMIEHRSVYAFICWCLEEFANTDFETVFAATSACFDLSVFEIFYTLCAGKKIRLLRNALEIPAFLASSGKVLLNTVPGVVGALLQDRADLGNVTAINMAGEPLVKEDVDRLDLVRMEVRNLYGPSEDTTYSTVYRLAHGAPLLIGKPIGNTKVYILNSRMTPVPPGVTGEIYIAGDGLARGYHNQPELSAAVFLPDPFAGAGRMYKTGDTGRWLHNGTIDFKGRSDNQVKVRGYRIEPGEIESLIRSYSNNISQAVVRVCEHNGDKVLAAYIVSGTVTDHEALRLFLRAKLPAFMVPGFYIALKQMPLTPTGKTDRNALPGIRSSDAPKKVFTAPRTATESLLALAWEKVLGKETIGVYDSFFELGGHSLKAIGILSRVKQAFGVDLDIATLFSDPTIAGMAVEIEKMCGPGSVYSSIADKERISL